ncbi:MAG: hypothetical protein PHH28_09800 [Desulfuromonadaceae bacterium]|nr:hypothetical protein [Desulfuromonadaceae bacterium]
MSIAQLSPNSVAATPAEVNPQVKTDLAASVPQINQDAQKTVQSAKTDTVTISPQAVQMLASDGDTLAVEAKETAAEKSSEKLRGKS